MRWDHSSISHDRIRESWNKIPQGCSSCPWSPSSSQSVYGRWVVKQNHHMGSVRLDEAGGPYSSYTPVSCTIFPRTEAFFQISREFVSPSFLVIAICTVEEISPSHSLHGQWLQLWKWKCELKTFFFIFFLLLFFVIH